MGVLAACGGALQSDPNALAIDGGKSDAPTVRVPEHHRASATKCDGVRSDWVPNISDPGPPASCHTHAECTQGKNGRCSGNVHDGWRCNYDECQSDTECGKHVCECGGGFRSDNDVCLNEGNCKLDAECGTQYCSPTLGMCGDYAKTVGYYCHTPKDECVDDGDCARVDGGVSVGERPYCAYDPKVSHWRCSAAQCEG